MNLKIFDISKVTSMYKGQWSEAIAFAKGDIVFIEAGFCMYRYFVCALPHTSDNVTFPSKEDIYWIEVDGSFITSLQKPQQDQGIVFLQPLTDLFKIVNENQQQDTTRPIRSRTPEPQRTRTVEVPSEEELEKKRRAKSLKRKLDHAEDELDNYKRSKNEFSMSNLKDQLLLLDVDLETKSFVVDKYENIRKMSGSDYSKGINWLKTVAGIPFGKCKPFPVQKTDSTETIKKFFDDVKRKLDEKVYGLDGVKQEILEYLARKITNPNGTGHVLALCGKAGVGKTKMLKSLAEALDLPFHQINCGGLNDVSILTGHSETYVGSKPGKIVEMLQNSNYMNPILYFDEIDKISEQKSKDIYGILTHILDEEQNSKFQDNYLSNINIDLSKVFFVLAFNDASKIDDIVYDRMKVIFIDSPSTQEKVQICRQKMLPEIMKNVKFRKNTAINLSDELIEYIVSKKCDSESGVRSLKKTLETIFYKLNYDILVGNTEHIKIEIEKNKTIYNITRTYIDKKVDLEKENPAYLSMYV